MTWEWIRRARSIVTRRRLEDDLGDEIQSHLELAAAEHVRRGMTPEAAAHRARRDFGTHGSMREAYRDRLKLPVLDDCVRDVRYGLRSVRRTPVETLVAVVTVAIAVGLTTVMLSAAYGAILRPPPFQKGDRVMGLGLIERTTGRTMQMEALDLRDFRARQTSFEALEGYYRSRISIADDLHGPQSIAAAFVTANALDHLGVRPALGRTFRTGEDFTSSVDGAVISHALWQARYGGQPEVIGTTLEADGHEVQIVGVMPDGFRFPANEDLWMPMAFDMPSDSDRSAGRSFAVFGRLRDGVSRQTAETEARAIARRLGEEHPDLFPPLSAGVFPFAEPMMPAGVDAVLVLLLAAALAVTLIACANLANLLTARSIARGLEIGIRHALGATRRQVARQFLIESMLVTLSGGVLGVALVWMGTDLFNAAVSGIVRPYWVDVRIDGPVLAAILVLIVAVAAAAGTLPAWHASREFDGARSGSAGLRARDHRGLGTAMAGLVTVQVALSFVLLVAAGLIIASLINLKTINRGYDAEHVMSASFLLPRSAYPDLDARSRLLLSVVERAGQHPGVDRAALVRREPGTGGTFIWPFAVEGENEPGAVADGLPVTHEYFETMGIGVVAGRDFLPDESRFGAEPVLIVNETLASRHLGPHPIGRRIRVADGEPWLTVVGVVEDSFIGSASGGIDLGQNPAEQIYMSWGVQSHTIATLVVRTKTDPAAFVPEAHALVAGIFPDVGLFATGSLADAIDRSMWAFPLFGGLFSVFGAAALSISVVGLYGIVSFSVGQRRRELRMRIALGADPVGVVWMTLRSALGQVGLGAAVGVAASLALVRLPSLQRMLFDVPASELRIVAGVLVVLVSTAFLAALVAPARLVVRPDLTGLLGREHS
jgi:putative ABC transport system permease protein